MKRVLSIFAGLILAAVATLVIATPASATWWGCPFGVGCVSTGYDGTGSTMVISVGQYGVGVCHNFSSPFNDSISSVTETYGSDLDLLIFIDSNCTSAIIATFFSGECAGTGGNGACNGTDSGAWNFNTLSRLKFDNKGSSFMIKSWLN